MFAAGNDAAGVCRIGLWHEVAVAAGNVHTATNTGRSHTVGLRSDGSVVATGWNGDGQCEVQPVVHRWGPAHDHGQPRMKDCPRILAEAKSYSERPFAFQSMKHLDDPLAARVLTEPATQESVTWAPDAVEQIVRDAAGYPYFLQQFGQETWNEAAGPDTITLTDARVGAAHGRAALDAGFFRARWDRATRSEQHYLRAMAADGSQGSGSGEVASRLGRRVTSLGPTRANLIAKGLVYAPEHGIVAFTVPGMADFIARQPTL